ncbi:hypothetical protein MSTE_03695 [Mycobacteroides stephanolepidis]|uniref:Uncharacterized protein n=1 Tax=[Mycobacterium] stephanolepidis TaxID=1520670 RepID=A0A1Z4F184_9MYCO|nr:hypothetical protein MSTE_03695 [[Mycobacterium] stephanolepidis]
MVLGDSPFRAQSTHSSDAVCITPGAYRMYYLT